MTKELLIHARTCLEKAGIRTFTVEFNNNYSINAGYEGHYVAFDDDNECLWEFSPRVNKFDDKSKMEVRCWSYSEVQFVRAGLDFRDAMSIAKNFGCELTDELTEVIKTLCGVTALNVQKYQLPKDGEKVDDTPELLNGMPSCRPGL